MRLIVLLALPVLLLGCLTQDFGVTITQPPPIKQRPIPDAFEGEEAPKLEATDRPGLFRAPELAENVWFHEPSDLWYRYTYRGWYQAFRWNGNWFIIEEPPEVLADVELVVPTLPELPELPELPDES